MAVTRWSITLNLVLPFTPARIIADLNAGETDYPQRLGAWQPAIEPYLRPPRASTQSFGGGGARKCSASQHGALRLMSHALPHRN
jgi:hypothetical protein